MADNLEQRFVDKIAAELGCRPRQVVAAAELLADGATVPFVARYRKEATGGLTDEQLETLAKRRSYFVELAERRDAVLSRVAEQGKLTANLERAIRGAASKQELEDLYLPYKGKRRTRASMARERGLEPLADRLLAAARGRAGASGLAAPFVDREKGVEDVDTALAGARDILAERFAENAHARAHLRRALSARSELHTHVLRGKGQAGKGNVTPEGGKRNTYEDYFDHREPAVRIPSHRLLAILRGEREGFLGTSLVIDDRAMARGLAKGWGVPLDTDCGLEVLAASEDGYKRLLRPAITTQVFRELRERAEAEAIRVFRDNLEALLTQAPFGQVSVVGLDPGYRTGCKLAVVDATGRVLDTGVIYPVEPQAVGTQSQVEEAADELISLVRRHSARAVAVGNGTGGRETEVFARRALREAGLGEVIVAIVPETGASVYSASTVARAELPELDVTLRGAVSIARRFQDPLAELVKIEPRSLGVGQYQHDVDQKALASELDTAVESTVNRVGVELNSASPSLLRRVSGLSARVAEAIVRHRDAKGRFANRRRLLDVAGFGPRAFQLAAGFLRISGGEHPLDRTAVHPERYPLVEAMAAELGTGLAELVGDPARVGKVRFDRFLDAEKGIGRFTLDDIKHELERPGRDPRPEYRAPELRDDVTSIDDLEPGMELEGRVSNVANFGAFVDLGVKRDGLVHISQLSDKWIDDPREAVRVGQVVRVRVLEIDRQRGRISLSMR
ncbi:MAG: RNA-binding transcriptional accessory protein [bacterium]|nr:RNA-binding transcriptional accessory protein [bacterium]